MMVLFSLVLDFDYSFLCFVSQRSGAKACWNVGGEACAGKELDQQRSSWKIRPLC